jgi:hypothetical protein
MNAHPVNPIGRPNVYAQIVKELGGVATPDEIYRHGTERGLLTCGEQGFAQSMSLNVRKGCLKRGPNGEITLPHIVVEKKPNTPIIRSRNRNVRDTVDLLIDRLHEVDTRSHGDFVHVGGQIMSIEKRLEAIEARLNALENKLP